MFHSLEFSRDTTAVKCSHMPASHPTGRALIALNSCGLHDLRLMFSRFQLYLFLAVVLTASVPATAFVTRSNTRRGPVWSTTYCRLHREYPQRWKRAEGGVAHHPTKTMATSDMASIPAERTKANKSIVVVGLNGALQRTVVFAPPKGLKIGGVNRAASIGTGIGGKGQNVCVALRLLAERSDGDLDVTLAHFAGGKSGEMVREARSETSSSFDRPRDKCCWRMYSIRAKPWSSWRFRFFVCIADCLV